MRVYLPKGLGNNRATYGALCAPSLQVAFGLEYLGEVYPAQEGQSGVYVASLICHDHVLLLSLRQANQPPRRGVLKFFSTAHPAYLSPSFL